MRSWSAVRRFLLLIPALLCALQANADTLVLQDRIVFGQLKAIGADTVTFARGCKGSETYPKSDIKRYERNSACLPKPIAPFSAGGGICTGDSIQLFEVVLKQPHQVMLASDVSVTAGRVHIRSADGLTQIHGPAARLVSITHGLFCRNSSADMPAVPGFCREAVQHAVNFGVAPVFSNEILTRGLSFFLEDEQGNALPVGDERGSTVREAFGTAITNWMAALQDLGPRLPSPLSAGRRGMLSASPGHFVLLTPPQVVHVGCRDSAMFTIRWVSKSEAPMRIGGSVKAARAEVEGRTIWINAKTYPCWAASLTSGLVIARHSGAAQCLNLSPVLTHEVGHALGLVGHADRGNPKSIMDSQISPALTRPTAADALDLAAVLATQIKGAPAGRMDADGAGVEVRLSH